MSDEIWNAFAVRALELGATAERPSRYADKPAVWMHGREIAHCEAPGLVDVRITSAGWRRAAERFGADPAVTKTAARRDWLELRLTRPEDVETYTDLIAQAVASNAR